jgi:fibronectin-binding autotransporter adhesin
MDADAEGTQTLSGSNSYTGGTNIYGGTLVAAHANALGTTGTITVAGGTLKLGVAFSRAVTMNSGSLDLAGMTYSGALTGSGGKVVGSGTYGGGGTLNAVVSPGSSPGTVSFSADTTLSGGYEWEVAAYLDNDDGAAGTNWDLLTSTGGTLPLGGPLTLKAGSLVPDETEFWAAPHAWTIANADGGLLSGSFASLPNDYLTYGEFSTQSNGSGGMDLI